MREQYLVTTAQLLRAVKARSYAWMEAQPGSRLLDVGCGVGLDLVALREIVGPEGIVAGIDRDFEAVAGARRRVEEGGLAGGSVEACADASVLPFSSGSFDAVRAERLLQHAERPSTVVAEMRRVLRPGGRAVLIDTDWGTASVASGLVEIERILARVRAERVIRDGYAGRALRGLAQSSGLQVTDVCVDALCLTDYSVARSVGLFEETEQAAISVGALSPDQVAEWRENLECRDSAGHFFSSVCVVTILATT